jgi:hypothetical protein
MSNCCELTFCILNLASVKIKYECWYDLDTIPMCRLKQAKGFRCILVKLCKSWWLPAYKKPMTLCTYKLINIWLSILTHRSLATPGVLGLSCLLLSLPLFPMLLSYLWSSLRSFPIPWPCLLLFHCKSSFHILFCLFLLAYCHITYPLSSSHIPSPRVHLTHRLNPFS